MPSEEKWLPIPGYEGIYEVSDCGNVQRIGKWTDGRRNRVRGLRHPDFCKGYPRVVLFRDQTRKRIMVHHLVMLAFVGPRPEGFEVNHKNGVRSDARIENLEYVTKSQNEQHKHSVLHCKMPRGSRHHAAKVTEDQVREMRDLRQTGWTLKRIAEKYSLGMGNVCWIVKGKHWKHV